jgi:hypothetical protein
MKLFVERIVVAAFVLCIILGHTLWGQAVSIAEISGTVRDQTGAVVPNADVKAIQLDTGLERGTKTGANGAYLLNNLPVGPYELRVEKQGFSTYVQTGLVLEVDSNPTINLALKVGSETVSVEVQAGAAMVETETTAIGQVVDQKEITELPLLNRQAINLIVLSGVANNTPGGDLNSNKNIPTVTFAVAGGLPNGTVYLLDGGTHNDPFNNLNLPLPFPDALREFKVETSSMPAQYGQHASAAINAVTRSGTNQFHGTAFEYIRNYIFNAKDYFQPTRDSLKQNQFGGVIGGPIKKDKLFFFGAYQATRARSNPTATSEFVPTQAMLNGDFTAYASCTGVTLKAPFVGNKISPSAFNTVAMNALTHIPVSTDPAGCGAIGVATPNNTNEWQTVGRVDYNINSTNSLYARYIIDNYQNPTITGAAGLANALLSSKTGQANQDQSFTLGETYIFNSSTTFSSHGTLVRTRNARFPSPFFSALDIGVNPANFYSPVALFTNIGFAVSNTGFSVGSSEPGYWNVTGVQFAEDVDLVRGNHQMSFGVDWIHAIMNSDSTAAANGNFTFGNGFTGASLSDFMMGDLNTFTQANKQLVDTRSNYIGVYAQDSWKVRSGLTLNYGLRWEPFLPEQDHENQSFNFDLGRFNAGTISQRYPQAPAGMYFPGDPGFPAAGFTSSKLSVFAPRVGIVWQPQADSNLTIRAGYGIFSDSPQMFFSVRFGSDAPWGPSLTSAAITTPGSFSDPWATQSAYNGKSPFPNASFFPVGRSAVSAYVTEPTHLKPAYLQQWNLSIQRQIGANLLVSAAYVGNETTHLPTGRELDPGVYIAGNCTANGFFPAPYSTVPDGLTKAGLCTQPSNINYRRQLYLANQQWGNYYGTIGSLDDGGVANYNGLLLSVRRRLTNHLSGFANWTWSHCLSDPPTTELTGPTYLNPTDRSADYSNCTSNRRSALNVVFVASTPTFANNLERHLLTGWQLSPIFRYQAGNYASVTLGSATTSSGYGDPSGSGIGNQRVIQVLSNPYLPNKGISGWLNPAAFTNPAVNGVFAPFNGAMRPLSIEMPGSVQMDASLSRTFAFEKTQQVEFHLDAFNAPNLVNLPAPSTSFSSNPAPASFGKFTYPGTSATGPRILQLSLKYVF